MTIYEPKEWQIECDHCHKEQVFYLGDYYLVSGTLVEDDLRQIVRGWIFMNTVHFCSLDCLIEYRRIYKDVINVATKLHVKSHIDICCHFHGTHAWNLRGTTCDECC